MPMGMPGSPVSAACVQTLLVGSGRKPPCQGASGRSLKVPLDHSRIVTRSTGKLAAGSSGTYRTWPCVLLKSPASVGDQGPPIW